MTQAKAAEHIYVQYSKARRTWRRLTGNKRVRKLRRNGFDAGPTQVGHVFEFLEFLWIFVVFGRFPWVPDRFSYPPGPVLRVCVPAAVFLLTETSLYPGTPGCRAFPGLPPRSRVNYLSCCRLSRHFAFEFGGRDQNMVAK